MKIFMTGSTGLIGRRITRELLRHGHTVTALARHKKSFGLLPIENNGTHRLRVVEGDATDSSSWQGELAHHDAVIALAGEPIFGRRWTKSVKQRILESRVNSMNAIAQALASIPAAERPKRLISASAVGYYGNSPLLCTEESPPGTGFLADVCVKWEQAAQALQAYGIAVTPMRLAPVLSAEGGILQPLRTVFRMFLGGRLGSGTQPFPWIHIDDVAALFLFALNLPENPGPINAVAPQLVTMNDFAHAFARSLHRPAALPLPSWLLRTVLGESAQIVLEGAHVVPEKALRLGYLFKHPTIAEALANLQ